jgi:membrane protease YdiL (CAAX protease family)
MFWPDFVRAALATAVGAIVVTLISLPLHSGEAIIRSALDFDRWLVWLIPVAMATFVQTSAEEVVFRGYIMQTLATRFRSPWVWAGLSILSFCLIHFSSTFGGPTNLMVVVFAAIFGTLATLLVWHTGNLGAAVGMHFVNNLVGFTLIGSQDFFGGGALFYSTPLSTLGWSQALFGLASSVVPLGIAMLLMFEERSPLRLR